MSPVSGSLILSEAEAIERGYYELNEVWKIQRQHRFKIHYPADGYRLIRGVWVNVRCPEISLDRENVYVDDVSFGSDGPAVLVDLTCIKFEDGEIEA